MELPAPTNIPARPDPYIERALNDIGYEIFDYTAGIAIQGDRKIKIGRLLRDPELIRRFTNDPARSGSKRAEAKIIISRHPYDIAGMSTNRGWTSCMNLNDGSNRKYVALDIKEGTIIAYLVGSTDSNITKPIARILLKPFINSRTKEVALGIENNVYGNAPPWFATEVEKWADKVNSSKLLNGIYTMPAELYKDDIESIKIIGDTMPAYEVAAALAKCSIFELSTIIEADLVNEQVLIKCAEFNIFRLVKLRDAIDDTQITPAVEVAWCKAHTQNQGWGDVGEVVDLLFTRDHTPCEEAILVALKDGDRSTLAGLRKRGYKLTPEMIDIGSELLLDHYYSDSMDYERWCDLIDVFRQSSIQIPTKILKEIASIGNAALYYATISGRRFNDGEAAIHDQFPSWQFGIKRLLLTYLIMIYRKSDSRPQQLLNDMFSNEALWLEYIRQTVPPDHHKEDNEQYPSLKSPNLETFHA